MYIEPGTNIKILNNIPLDNTYEHTIFFDNVNNQINYFIEHVKYNLSEYTYQRVNRGYSRVGIKAELLYDCNYIMFQNKNFGNKWFFAFIKSIEYINNETSEIEFEIDVIQTWYFDFNLDICFIDRTHLVTDYIGENITPEPIEIGEYVYNNFSWVYDMRELSVIIAVVDTNSVTNGNLYDGVFGGATLYAYPASKISDIPDIVNKINEYIQQPDAILSIYMLPTALIGAVGDNHIIEPGGRSLIYSIAITKPGVNTKLDDYLPNNCKLYTYPYTFLHVDNASSQSLSLRYEFFGKTPKLNIRGTITNPVQIRLTPQNYKNIGEDESNITETLTVSNFPMCSWAVDSYQAWLAQNSIPILGNILSGLASTTVSTGLSSAPVATAAGGTINTISNLLMSNYKASIAADICKGSFQNGGVNTSAHTNQFYMAMASVNKQQLYVIDDFFDKFGYAYRRLATPKLDARKHWTYIKTVSASITGSIPSDDMKKICRIFDSGITYWKNGDEVGKYGLDNRAEERGQRP